MVIISKTHFTNKSYIKAHSYTVYDTKHPDGTAHGGNGIIIKNSLKHAQLESFQMPFLLSASVRAEDWYKPIYNHRNFLPTKPYDTKENNLRNILTRLGDYNAKHQHWGHGRPQH